MNRDSSELLRMTRAKIRHETMTVAVILLALLLAACSILARFYYPLHADNLIYLHGAEYWLRGVKPYRDVVDMNMPTTFLMNILPVLLGKCLGIPNGDALVLVVSALAAGSSATSYRLLIRSAPKNSTLPSWLLLAIVAAYFILPQKNFGQREHWISTLVVPYAISVAGRIEGRSKAFTSDLGPKLGLALAVLIKPFYGLAWLGLELYAAIAARQRLRRTIAEALPVAATVCLAGVVYLIAFPQYLAIAKVASRYYEKGFRVPYHLILYRPEFRIWLFGAAISVLLPFRSDTARLRGALSILSLTCLLAAIAQHKGWDYHFLPALTTALLWVMLACYDAFALVSSKHAPVRAAICSLVLISVALYCTASLSRTLRLARLHGQRRALWQTPLSQLVARCGQNISVLGMAVDLRATWTMIYYSNARWASRYYHPWPLPGLAKEGVTSIGAYPNAPSDSVSLASQLREQLAKDIEVNDPDVLIFDRAQLALPIWSLPFGWDEFAFLDKHPKLHERLRQYTPLGDFGFLRVVGRRGKCAPVEASK